MQEQEISSIKISNKPCQFLSKILLCYQHANECFCGNGRKLYTSGYGEAASDQCNFRCIQNEEENCGGEYKISVYKSNTGTNII